MSLLITSHDIFRAPHDCQTFITGASGFITSYGWQSAQQMTSMAFSHCIRREVGYCSISYNEAITSSTIDTFEISDDADTVFVSILELSLSLNTYVSTGANSQWSKLHLQITDNMRKLYLVNW